MIKMIPVKCPECGASIEIDKERSFGFCSYCGSKVIINNENEQIIRNIDEAAIKKSEVEKELELKKLELEEERRKYARAMEQKNQPFRIVLVIIWIAVTAALFIIGSRMIGTGIERGHTIEMLALAVGIGGGLVLLISRDDRNKRT